MTDASDLKTAVAFIKRSRKRPAEVRVDIKGWVRIKRDIGAMCMVLPTPYSRVPDEDKWLWHEHKARMKLAPIQIMGIPVVRVSA